MTAIAAVSLRALSVRGGRIFSFLDRRYFEGLNDAIKRATSSRVSLDIFSFNSAIRRYGGLNETEARKLSFLASRLASFQIGIAAVGLYALVEKRLLEEALIYVAVHVPLSEDPEDYSKERGRIFFSAQAVKDTVGRFTRPQDCDDYQALTSAIDGCMAEIDRYVFNVSWGCWDPADRQAGNELKELISQVASFCSLLNLDQEEKMTAILRRAIAHPHFDQTKRDWLIEKFKEAGCILEDKEIRTLNAQREQAIQLERYRRFEVVYNRFLQMLQQGPENISISDPGGAHWSNDLSCFSGQWVTELARHLSDLRQPEMKFYLEPRREEILTALREEIQKHEERTDYQNRLNKTLAKALGISLSGDEISALRAERVRQRCSLEKKQFFDELADNLDRVFDNEQFLAARAGEFERAGVPLTAAEVETIIHALLARFADDFSALVDLEYLDKLDKIASILGRPLREAELIDALATSEDPLLLRLVPDSYALPSAGSVGHASQAMDSLTVLKTTVAGIVKQVDRKEKEAIEIENLLGTAGYWLQEIKNPAMAFQALRLFGQSNRIYKEVSRAVVNEAVDKRRLTVQEACDLYFNTPEYIEALTYIIVDNTSGAKDLLAKAILRYDFSTLAAITVRLLRRAHRPQITVSDEERYLGTLGLKRGATWGEVQKSWKRIARATHPDMHGPAKETEFKAASEAYRALERLKKEREEKAS